jgi:hypothetical protein
MIVAAGCVALTLAASGCGSSSEPGHASSSGSKPTEQPTTPEYAGLSAYKRRCSQIDLKGALAQVVYKPRQQMTRGDTTTVTAAVTLDQSALPSRVLRSTGAVASPAIVVACVIEARLGASSYIFNLDERGWLSRSFLTSDTARWTWNVGPKVGGTQTLTLEVRPIVRLAPASGSSDFAGAESSDVQSYPIKVQVKVPWTERPAEVMSRLADTFKVAQGLVEATTALLAALLALAAVLGIRRSKAKDATASTGGANP